MSSAPIVVKTLIRTGQRCPSQWEGETCDGRYVYVRYRSGILSIGIGQSLADAIEQGDNLFEKQIGDHLDGSLELEQLREATKSLVDWPETYEYHPDPIGHFRALVMDLLEKFASECEDRAELESEPRSTQLREEAKLYRKELDLWGGARQSS